ncbi:MAG TPA: hypothetical protein VEI50_06635 [Nitrospiraceae bacterium]|nr:hypothetical protein [Nitrospiraceae bacterium]
MRSFSSQHRFCATATNTALALLTLCLVVCPGPGLAEWYLAGYGGYTTPSSLSNVTMDNFGEQLGLQQFPGAAFTFTPPQGTLAQTFHSSDVSLKNSPLFGGKAGYFFKDEGFSWLGVEVEAFTSQPTIKSQTVTTTQTLTYVPFHPNSVNNPAACATALAGPPPFPIDCPAQITKNGTLQLSESSMRLITVAFNVVARYPGKVLQPYVGVGVGAFYFNSSDQISGRQVVPGLNSQVGLKVLATEEWGFFIEGKYNYAQITTLDNFYGLSGNYSAFSALGGIAYHF